MEVQSRVFTAKRSEPQAEVSNDGVKEAEKQYFSRIFILEKYERLEAETDEGQKTETDEQVVQKIGDEHCELYAFTEGSCVAKQERRSTGIDRPSLVLSGWFAVTSAST